MIYPNKIKHGDIIATTAMSGGLEDKRDENRVNYASENFINKGFKIVETADVRKNKKLVSTNAVDRANEFMELWERADVPYIIITWGGEFLMETIPYIEKERIQNSKPKWVQGFSDVSLLNFYLTTNFDIATIHSHNFSAYAMENWDRTLNESINFLMNSEELVQESYELYETDRCRDEGTEKLPFNYSEKVVYKSLFEEDETEFSGRLLGGCIDVLKTIIGTPFDNTKNFCNEYKEGMIWYIENCEMSVTDLKRALWQMKMADWFENTNGILVGRTHANLPIGEFTYEDALKDIFEDMNIPVIYDVDFGHTEPQWTMINGAFAEFKYSNGKGNIVQKMI